MAKFFIENYGCQMNVSESDSLRNLLKSNGHIETTGPHDADAVIINTCSVRNTAEIRIWGRLGYYREINENRKIPVHVIVMGCMAQNVGAAMKKKFPDVVSVIWGTYNKDGILDYFNNFRKPKDHLELDGYTFMDAKPQNKYSFKSFLPISHGCDNYCSYCIVPYVRSNEIHRKSSDIITNIKRLMDIGVKEIILLGQNVNSYQDEDIHFPDLLDRIVNQTQIERLSFMTSHPKDFGQKLADVMIQYPNIMKNVHLPVQAGSDRILKLMNRKYTVENYLEKIEIAGKIPDVIITTDIIVGFPSETDKDFQDTLELIEKVRFQEIFTYHYNTRPGTSAAQLPDDVPKKEKLDRLTLLIDAQRRITNEALEKQIGSEHSFLIESVSKKNKHELSGRTHNGLAVFIEGDKKQIGTLVRVMITGISGSGLKGRII
jgi:tRNA-2-methylthio-N6-dimethylallyladenosine synthase